MDWTNEWPTELGWYWFYGDLFSKDPPWKHIMLRPVKVSQGGNSLIFVSNGSFIYKSEASDGLWQPMIVPELPNT